jgi:hypothetical protein
MDSFWSKLLILGIVAAIGLFFIGNVYAPQKAAQEAMADSTQQSVNAVKMGIEDTTSLQYSGDDVIDEIQEICEPGNTRTVIVKVGSATYLFTTSDTYGGQEINSIVSPGDQYRRETSASTITFTKL